MTDRKMIYLDYNIFESYRVNDVEDLRAAVDAIKDKHVLPYSPAHLEDLASSLMWKDFDESEIPPLMERSQDRLQNIIDISKSVEVFPAPRHQPTRVIREHPGECLLRVLEHFDRNLFLEVRERNLLEDMKATDVKGERSSRVSNLPVNFLSAPEYDSAIMQKYASDRAFMQKKREAGLTDLKWPDISKSHEVLEHVFEILMNYLEEIRFRPEDINKSRSRMHDVTHAIYATKADYFITGDVRFYHKVRAIYDYLRVPTTVLTLNEFLKSEGRFE
ncbi:hypothetical protein [Pseudomonas fluorescens]|uniref:hypothetical protein n=1 Tax=Pseudomonas fluorescens TaxID=294 RepID=UPI000F4A2BD7|nr:hypothetical protein [Pseudomonas fluorescens]RON91648.1 hypothetical protein BK668_08570 [Pseudomonas fluorescens]